MRKSKLNERVTTRPISKYVGQDVPLGEAVVTLTYFLYYSAKVAVI